VDLEDGFGGIKADHGNGHGGRLLFDRFRDAVMAH